jgi:Holliday junction resolvase
MGASPPECPREQSAERPSDRRVDPERSRRGRSNRRRGRDFERAVVAHLERIGGEAILVSGSHGPYDVVWLRHGQRPALIEVKLGGYMTPLEREAIRDAAWKAGADARMAWKPGRGRIELKDVKA